MPCMRRVHPGHECAEAVQLQDAPPHDTSPTSVSVTKHSPWPRVHPRAKSRARLQIPLTHTAASTAIHAHAPPWSMVAPPMPFTVCGTLDVGRSATVHARRTEPLPSILLPLSSRALASLSPRALSHTWNTAYTHTHHDHRPHDGTICHGARTQRQRAPLPCIVFLQAPTQAQRLWPLTHRHPSCASKPSRMFPCHNPANHSIPTSNPPHSISPHISLQWVIRDGGTRKPSTSSQRLRRDAFDVEATIQTTVD